jgi:hypothetical protein
MADETGVTPVEGGEGNATTSTEGKDFFDSFMAGDDAPGETSSPEEAQAESATSPEGTVSTSETSEGVDEASALRAEIGRMAAVMASHGITFLESSEDATAATETQTSEVSEQPAKTVTTSAPQWGPIVELSDEDFQASLENKDVLQKILTTVRDQAVERTVQSIPQLVSSMIKQQLYLNELSREFYQANEDLAGIRPFVGVIANEIASKNTGLSPAEVLEKTAVEVRKRLQMKEKAVATTTTTSGVGLPNPTSRQKVAQSNLTGLEKELEQLMNVQ